MIGPTVNNFSPLPPQFTVSTQDLPTSADGPRLKITIKTDRDANPSFDLAFDGPYRRAEVALSYGPAPTMNYERKGTMSRPGDQTTYYGYGFNLIGRGFPANGEIYITVYADNPIKLIRVQPGT